MAPKKKIVKTSGRRKKAETKAEQVEVKTAAESLLIGNMPKIKDLSYHMGQIAGYIDKSRTAAKRVTEAKASAKEAGCDVAAIMDILSMKRADPLETATYFRQLAAMMQEEGTPIQIQLFEASYDSIDAQAAAEGWRDGKAARTPDTTRWPEGAPGSVSYMRRWNDAQRDTLIGDATGVSEDDDSSEER